MSQRHSTGSGRTTASRQKARERSQIPGHATADGTLRLARRFKRVYIADFYRPSAAGLTLSSIGMGTYLGECDDREDGRYADSLTNGLAQGLNVIDTAINYRCQRSERAVGRSIRDAIESGTAARDEIVVCTKGGYVPLDGAPPVSRAEYDRYLRSEYFDSSIMSSDDVVAGGHCLRPGFISNQIERSRSNLGVECIDVYYLHNPEQQLDSLDRGAFATIMGNAFAEMEAQVEAGKIGHYGCATWNGFRIFAANRNHLSLSELVDLAESIAGKSHHFRFVQLPVNLAMTEAVRAPTQSHKGKNFSLLELAQKLGISVVGSASLMQAQLTRNLPSTVRSLFPSCDTDAQCAIAFVRSLPLSSALAGMRSPEHLEENIASARQSFESELSR